METKLQVRFSDVDIAGHVHNAVYFQYFEQGRVDLFLKKISGPDWDWKRKGLILARNEIDYKKPLTLQSDPSVETFVIELGKKSMTLGYRVCDNWGERCVLCAEGKSVLVCYDYEKQESIEIPDVWREKLQALK